MPIKYELKYELRGVMYDGKGYQKQIRRILRESINAAISQSKDGPLLGEEILDRPFSMFDHRITDPLHALLADYLKMYAEVIEDEAAMTLDLGNPPEGKYATLAIHPNNTIFLTTYNTGRENDGIPERWPPIEVEK